MERRVSDVVLEGLKRRGVNTGAGVFVAIAVIGVLFAFVRLHPNAPAAPAIAAPLKSVDNLISSTTIEGQTLTVREQIPGASAYGDVRLVGSTAEAIGKAVQRGGYVENLASVKTVIIVAVATTQDLPGHQGAAPFLSFSLSGDDLRVAQYENLGPAGVLDLAQTVQLNSREAVKALADYCVKYGSASRHFCSKAPS
jgi:hypothetical protein